MASFERTTVTANVPAFLAEEGTIQSENNEFVVFKTKKRRSSRSLTRYIPRSKLIAVHTKEGKEGSKTTVYYLDEKFPIEFRNIEFTKLSTSNTPGFASAKTSSGTLVLNTKYMAAHTETSSGEVKLEKAKKGKKDKKEKNAKK